MNFDNAFNRVADFYDQITEFISFLGQSFGRGFNSVEELWETVQNSTVEMYTIFSGFVNPWFIPFLAFCLGVSLLHKVTKTPSKG